MKKRKKKINNKGYSAINVIICVLVIILTFNLLIEFTLMGQRYSYISQTSSYVSRLLGEQGGISNSIPNGYHDSKYYTKSSELYGILTDGFETAKFDDWNIYINGSKLKSNTNISIPEKERIHITIEAGYYPIFNFMNNSDKLVKVKTERTIYSSFTPRNKDIILIK